MSNVRRKITLYRKLRDGNPCPNDQSGGLKHDGKVTFERHTEFERKQLEKKFIA
jgi:hypothetical protein